MSITDLLARRNRIVEIIVEEFIQSAEPIGSLLIVQEYRLGVSPATIRNLMAKLEEEGLLTHPHTSAGRVPTDQGYRYYVDRLMRPEPIGDREQTMIDEVFRQADEPEGLWMMASRLVAELTGEAGLILYPRMRRAPLQHLELMLLGSRRLMALVVTRPGLVQQLTISLTESLAVSELERIENFFNREFTGQTLDEIVEQLERRMLAVEDSLFQFIRLAKALFDPESALAEGQGLHWEGLSRLMGQPEMQDPQVAQGLLKVVEFPKPFIQLLEQELEQSGARIRIGQEQPLPELAPFASITSSYGVGANRLGVLGIVGPKRLPYAKAVSQVQQVAEALSRRLGELLESEA